MTHPERDPRDEHREFLDVDAVHVAQRNEGQWSGGGGKPGLPCERDDARLEIMLERSQLSIGEIEEVPAPTGWIEHPEAAQLVEQCARLRRGRRRLDPHAPGRHDRRPDDLHDVGLVGVMRAELPPPLVPETGFHQRAEDRRVDQPPVEFDRPPERLELGGQQVNLGRSGEQLAVHVPGAGQDPLPAVVVGVVEDVEERAHLGIGRALGMDDQVADDALDRLVLQHPEVLGEETPHELHDERPQRLRGGGPPGDEGLVEIADDPRGVLGEPTLTRAEERHVAGAGEEEQRLVAVGQLVQGELRARTVREAARLPHLELPERAEHDVRRGGPARPGIRRRPPVVQRLPSVLRQPVRFGRRLHLDDNHARQMHIHDPHRGMRVLEDRAQISAVRAVAGDELVEEALRLAPLGAGVVPPASRELRQRRPDLLAAGRRAGGHP